MGLQAGTKLGPYQIQAPLGAGGMGEVYKATDTRLDRTVAVKVLPAELASDLERRERFEREAKTISSLNHPHICTLYDVGHQDGVDYLVMEHIEGETLQDRLIKGALPLDQALRYAIEIADALDKAHRQGIVHRDLKPGNIMLTKAGAKLLDFGLAKLRGPADATGGLSALPTQEANLTAEGSIVGTFQYMAPEQLEGGEADHRTDIWAFGCVVYEMVTGKKAFEGKSQASLISAIMSAEPRPLSTLQPMSPPMLDRVIRICLAKDPEERWQSMGDVRQQLTFATEGGARVEAPSAGHRSARMGSWGRAVVFAVATLIVGALIGSFAVWHLVPAPALPAIARFVVDTPPDGPALRTVTGSDLAISSDGTIAYVSGSSNLTGRTQVYVRPLSQLVPTPLKGAEAATNPIFSPDGEWIAFHDPRDRTIKRVSTGGGPPVTVATLGARLMGHSWGADDTIVFATEGSGGLMRVPAVGGEAEVLTRVKAEEGERAHRWPEVLPNGKAVMFTVWPGVAAPPHIAVLSLESGEVKPILSEGTSPRYSATGHVVYAVQGSLRAVGFDAEQLTVTGDPVPVLDHVDTKMTGAANFNLSANGALVYMAGAADQESDRALVWVDRQGGEERVAIEPGRYSAPRLSPDGTRVAVVVTEQGNPEILVYDLLRAAPTRLTFDPGVDSHPVWAPDGGHVVFASDRDGQVLNLFRRAADGAEDVERLTTSVNRQVPFSWAPTGPVYSEVLPETSADIALFRMDERRSEFVIQEAFNQREPAVSPSGEWIAYESTESGQQEIYVRPFPNASAGKWRISSNGGTKPAWAPAGSELFYLNGDLEMMVVPFDVSSTFTPGIPTVLFDADPLLGSVTRSDLRPFDVSPDGQRFLMAKWDAALDPIVIVENWHRELLERVPVP